MRGKKIVMRTISLDNLRFMSAEAAAHLAADRANDLLALEFLRDTLVVAMSHIDGAFGKRSLLRLLTYGSRAVPD